MAVVFVDTRQGGRCATMMNDNINSPHTTCYIIPTGQCKLHMYKTNTHDLNRHQ